MKEKAKSSYQHLTEKYHHAAVECEQKDKRIKELERKIVSLDGENNRLYQQACKAEEELLKYTAEPDKKHGCETCKHQNIDGDDLPCAECYHADQFKNPLNQWQPKKQPPDPYQVFRDAIKAGKQIQFKNRYDIWGNAEDPNNQKWSFVFPPDHYRIKPEPVYISFSKEELKSLVGKVITNASNPDNVCIITRYQGLDFVESGKLQIPASNLVKYWLLDGKPCGKEQK